MFEILQAIKTDFDGFIEASENIIAEAKARQERSK